jgi:CBS domain-containing protein
MKKTLGKISARDLMQSRVVTLPAGARVSEAIQIFEDDHISGIPVVNNTGQVVGMLTEHDVARTDHVRHGRIEHARGEYDFSASDEDDDSDFPNKEDYSPELLGEDLVKDWMTPKVIAVLPSSSLKEVCETMTSEGVHRVLVIEKRKLLGIISSFDVVRCLSQAL